MAVVVAGCAMVGGKSVNSRATCSITTLQEKTTVSSSEIKKSVAHLV